MFQNLVMNGLTPLCNTNEVPTSGVASIQSDSHRLAHFRTIEQHSLMQPKKKQPKICYGLPRDLLDATPLIQNWDNRPFNGKWPEIHRSCNRGANVKKPIRKKPKRVRTAYSTNQLQALEKIYSTSKYIDVKRRKQLSETMNIGDKALKIWFQNRRMKEKKETSESSCDTSSETLSCQSPANDYVQQKGEVNISYPDFSQCYQPDQYQFPTFYYNEGVTGHYQNGYPYEHNGTSFGVETKVYPTQYYPTDSQYNNVDTYGNYNSNQVQDTYEMESWYTKSFNLSYFTTQQT